MKKAFRIMTLIAAFTCVAALGLLAYVRLAPSDPAVWHVGAALSLPDAAGGGTGGGTGGGPALAATDGAVAMPGGAYAVLPLAGTDAATLLGQLDSAAQTFARTTLLAGTPEEGRMTWITRSRIFGFPDYTTADAVTSDLGNHLIIIARQRFGREDMGVNLIRLKAWLAQLSA